jgi:hypothetical protein
MSYEMLSKALDGECSSEDLDRLLGDMDRDPELKRAWSRLCIASDTARGSRVTLGQTCICSGVMEAIGRDGIPSSKVVGLIPRRRGIPWKPLVGLAAAASIAGVALLGFNFSSPSSPDLAIPSNPGLSASAAGANGYVDASSQDQSQVQPGWNSISSEDARQLDDYLVDHSNYRTVSGMSDTLGYARFAAHTAEYHPDRR